MAVVVAAAVLVAACSSDKSYEKAFSQKTALANNSHRYQASADQTFRAAKISLVQQGFAIEQVDATNGLLKGMRTYDSPSDKKIAFLVTTTMDITSISDSTTVVTVSASQQTVLHRDSEKYYHLLGLVPIPTGKEYQTVVRSEGDITGAGFYQDLFEAITRNMPPAPAVVVTALPPAPAAVAVPVAAPVAAAAPETAAAPATPPAAPAATPAADAPAAAPVAPAPAPAPATPSS